MLALVLVLVGIVAFVMASGIAAVTRRLTGKDALSVMLGTLTLPAVVLALLAYWLMTSGEVDDPPPGMVILANLAIAGVTTPVALLASLLTVRFLSRRSVRNASQHK